MKYHKIADIFPLLVGEELNRLAEDIKENGQREPIVLFEDQILDGRNRYRACEMHGIEPITTEYTGDDPLRYVISLNLHRRHLKETQRGMITARFPKRKLGDNQYSNEGSGIPPPSQAEAAKMLNVSLDTVKQAAKVKKQGAPELVKACDNGEITLGDAVTVLNEPKEEQAELVNRVITGEAPTLAKAKPHVTKNSGDNEWYTPEKIIQSARETMGEINLDPASTETANEVVGAEEIYTAEDDGLQGVWKGKVWMNPPYDKKLVPQFISKLVDSVEDGSVTEAIALVNNATETKWFAELMSVASAVCFPTGRVKFWQPGKEEGTPLQGQAIVYIGGNVPDFAKEFFDYGFILEPCNEF